MMTIRDSDFAMESRISEAYKERRASRAIVFDKENKVALLHVTKKHYHKLPGGGIEDGESMEVALRRELLEEIGCSVGNVRELGIIEEYRNISPVHQLSYCFLAELVGEKGVRHLEEGEIADGFETVWLSLEDAIKTLEGDAPVEDYNGKFIQKRDIAFLRKAQQK